MRKPDAETQVIIYMDDPAGQLIQTSYSEYVHYWYHIGWQLQGEAPELPDMPRVKGHGLQAGLI